MKRIVNVQSLKDKKDVERLENALRETRLDFEVNLELSCVILKDGTCDVVRIARLVIEKAGFSVL